MRCLHVQYMDHYYRTDKIGPVSTVDDWLRFLPTVMTQLITQYHYGLYNWESVTSPTLVTSTRHFLCCIYIF